MGYGKRAVSLLKLYYEGNIPRLDDASSGPGENIEGVDDSEIGLLEERIGQESIFMILGVGIIYSIIIHGSVICYPNRILRDDL